MFRLVMRNIGLFLHYFNLFTNKCKAKYNVSIVNAEKNCRINGKTKLHFPSHIFIGENTYINGGILAASKEGSIYIGKNCCIADGVFFRTDQHEFINSEKLINSQGHNHNNIYIGDDCWIGYGVVVLSGVRLGNGCVIGAGSVVTKDTIAYGVYVGIPAKLIKMRKQLNS